MASAERRGFVRDTVTDALVTTTDDALAADNGSLPARQEVIAGYDGANTQVVKVSAAGLLQVDVLSSPAGASTVALDAPTLAALESITAVGPLTDAQLRAAVVPTQDSRLPAALDADGGVKVHAQSAIPVTDNAGSLTVDSVQLPAALAAGGGLKVEGVAGGVAQPVSMATQTPDVTDRDARLLGRAKLLDSAGAVIDPALKGQLPVALVGGRLSVDASGVAVPITDNAGSLTVDAPVGTPAFVRLSDGAAAVAPLTDTQLRASAVPVQLPPATLAVTGTAAAGTGVTATLAAVAAQFHYIVGIRIVKIASVATVGAAAPTVITTTNLPGALAWSLPTALAVGTQWEVSETFAQPLKSSVVNTATTIVAAGLASIIYRITVYYYTAA